MICIVGESHADRLFGELPTIKANYAEIDVPKAAVIVGKNGKAKVRSALGIIVDGDSCDQNIPRGIQLITCGISPKNTVSVTSRTDEKLTLSLNRSIRTEHGVIEPLEQPVDIRSGISEYDIMAAFAAKLLLEQ